MNFFYEALDESGQTVLGKIDGANETEVRQKLLLLGYQPQSIAPNPATYAAPPPGPVYAQTGVRNGASAMPGQALQAPPQVAPLQERPRTGGITMAGNAARVAAK